MQSKGISNAFILSKNHCECLSFWPKGIANAFLFTLNGNFSLTIGMIMPLGWANVTGIIPKLVTQGPFGFPTCHLWLVTRGESKWAFVTCYGIIFSFHKCLAVPVPSPQPKGIKTFLSRNGKKKHFLKKIKTFVFVKRSLSKKTFFFLICSRAIVIAPYKILQKNVSFYVLIAHKNS